MKEVIVQVLKKALAELKVKLSNEEIIKYIEVPPNMEMGDFAFPCFFLSRILQEEPHEIAEQRFLLATHEREPVVREVLGARRVEMREDVAHQK